MWEFIVNIINDFNYIENIPVDEVSFNIKQENINEKINIKKEIISKISHLNAEVWEDSLKEFKKTKHITRKEHWSQYNVKDLRDILDIYTRKEFNYANSSKVQNIFTQNRVEFNNKLIEEVNLFNFINSSSFTLEEYLNNPNLNMSNKYPYPNDNFVNLGKEFYRNEFYNKVYILYQSQQIKNSMICSIDVVRSDFDSLYDAYIEEKKYNSNIRWNTVIELHLNEYKEYPLGHILKGSNFMSQRVNAVSNGKGLINSKVICDSLNNHLKYNIKSAKDSNSYIKILENSKILQEIIKSKNK